MIDSIKKRLDRRKVKIFSFFILCSSAAWFISKLSESYVSTAVFDLSYTNAPDTLLLVNRPKEKVDVRLRASGFQFLNINFKSKRIKIDLDHVRKKKFTYFVASQEYRKQIEKQLPKTMQLLDMDTDTLFFKFKQLYKKKVPIKPRLGISLAPNFILEGKLTVKPDSMVITGLKEEINSISTIFTEKATYENLDSDFSYNVPLARPSTLVSTVFPDRDISISGKVVRFSEKVINVPVTVVNLPLDMELRTFPNVVSILCKAKIERLKKLEPSDFKLIVDYNDILDNPDKILRLELVKSPSGVHSARLLEDYVEYILKRQ